MDIDVSKTAGLLFIEGTRKKWRYTSKKGLLTVEDLWNLPLLARAGSAFEGCDLNSVAVAVDDEITASKRKTFTATKTVDSKVAELEKMLDLVKYVIAVREEEAEAVAKRNSMADKRRELRDALAAARARELGSASVAELEKKLAELDAQ